MLICRRVKPDCFVWLTDNPDEARRLSCEKPVIGITGPEPEYELWFGVLYLAADLEAADEEYCERVWSRFYKKPVTIVREEGWCLRETSEKDLPVLTALYRDSGASRFLEHPLGADEDTAVRWQAWLTAYRRYVYEADGPAMWTIADAADRMVGRFGLEWHEGKEFGLLEEYSGYYLGYALLPQERGKGWIRRAAEAFFPVAREEWELDTLYLICDKENQASAKTAERLGFVLIQEQCRHASFLLMSVSISEIRPRT